MNLGKLILFAIVTISSHGITNASPADGLDFLKKPGKNAADLSRKTVRTSHDFTGIARTAQWPTRKSDKINAYREYLRSGGRKPIHEYDSSARHTMQFGEPHTYVDPYGKSRHGFFDRRNNLFTEYSPDTNVIRSHLKIEPTGIRAVRRDNASNATLKMRYELKPEDIDWRGTGRTYRDALDMAFEKTRLNRHDFEVTKWGRDASGKSFPVEYRHHSGAEVNMDWAHSKNGPDAPHIGWQTGGKRGSGGAIRGHIIVDSVPYNR